MIGKILVLLSWIAGALFWIFWGRWFLVIGLLVLHGIEVFTIGMKTGREHGVSAGKSAFLTMLFGVAWWGPLKRRP